MHNKRKILFVDDEPRVLSGLRHVLYHKSDEWDTSYAESGENALNLLEHEKFNVIVTDMRMPYMDGAKLLKKVQDVSPETIRIVLSGQSDIEMVMRIVNVAHQFLTKPCNPKHLEEIISRSCRLQDLLRNENLRNVIGKIEKLPSLSKTYQVLTTALEKENITSEDIALIVEQDIAMSAKLLQLSNSAFFGLPNRTTSILRAVNYVGFDTLKNLTLGIGVFDTFDKKDKKAESFLNDLQHHSLMCANLAMKLLNDPRKSKDAFLAGLLHDIGKLILMSNLPDKYAQVLEQAKESKQDLAMLERAVIGITHAEIGGYLLGIWGIPYPIVEAVTFHHEPTKVGEPEFGVLSAVYVANRLLEENDESRTLDMDYLRALKVDHMVPKWLEMAESVKGMELN